jgi:hypothetical protein
MKVVERSSVDQLYLVLWSYQTAPYSCSKETPFRLVYGVDAVIPVEIGELTWKMLYSVEENDRLLMEDLNLEDEIRETARIK